MKELVEVLDERQLKAALTVLEYADVEPTERTLARYLQDEIVTFTEDECGHYCWYMDDEGNEICLHVETLEEIDTTDLA